MIKTDYEDFDIRVDRFLSRKMTSEEEAAFKAELTSSKDLMERAQMIALMINEMRLLKKEQNSLIAEEVAEASHWHSFLGGMNVASVVDDMDSVRSDSTAMNPPSSDSGGTQQEKVHCLWPKIMSGAVAACMAGVVFMGIRHAYTVWQYQNLATERQYQAYVCDNSDDFAHFRGDVLMEGSVLAMLYRNVQTGENLEITVRQLEQLYAEALKESSALYDFRDDLAWNLAFAYLKKGEGKKAIPVLEEMLKRNERYPVLANPIRDLLDKLYQI